MTRQANTRRQPQRRRWPAWTCAAIAGALTLVMVLSLFIHCGFELTARVGGGLGYGQLALRVDHDDQGTAPTLTGPRIIIDRASTSKITLLPRYATTSGYAPTNRIGQTGTSSVGIPLWLLAAPFAVAAVILYQHSRRPIPGFCTCGYDLDGLKDRQPCPECGAASPSVTP